MGCKSADCAGQDISWKICCSSLLLMYFWQSLLVCFRSLSCISTNPWATSCSKWDGVMQQFAVIANQFAVHLAFQLARAPPHTHTHIHHNRASSMLYGWYDTGGCSSFPNSSLHIDLPIWPKDFELCSLNPNDFIPLLYCPVFVCFLTLFCFLNSGFSTTILSYRPASQSLLLTVNADTFFSRHWFNCGVMFRAVSLL